MKLLYDTALSFLNTPTIWGGENFLGYDCSGLVQEILRSAGVDPQEDQNAQALYNHFSVNHVSQEKGLGALVFYGTSVKAITHVTLMLSTTRMIEAGGARPDIKTQSDAARARAFVRIRPLRYTALQGIFMPEYPHCEF